MKEMETKNNEKKKWKKKLTCFRAGLFHRSA